jgi:hypothetical protein
MRSSQGPCSAPLNTAPACWQLLTIEWAIHGRHMHCAQHAMSLLLARSAHSCARPWTRSDNTMLRLSSMSCRCVSLMWQRSPVLTLKDPAAWSFWMQAGLETAAGNSQRQTATQDITASAAQQQAPMQQQRVLPAPAAAAPCRAQQAAAQLPQHPAACTSEQQSQPRPVSSWLTIAPQTQQPAGPEMTLELQQQQPVAACAAPVARPQRTAPSSQHPTLRRHAHSVTQPTAAVTPVRVKQEPQPSLIQATAAVALPPAQPAPVQQPQAVSASIRPPPSAAAATLAVNGRLPRQGPPLMCRSPRTLTHVMH